MPGIIPLFSVKVEPTVPITAVLGAHFSPQAICRWLRAGGVLAILPMEQTGIFRQTTLKSCARLCRTYWIPPAQYAFPSLKRPKVYDSFTNL
jgi:hypothetical protein